MRGGSGTVLAARTAQMLFGGDVPENGFLVQNNSPTAMWVNDMGIAEVGSGIRIAGNDEWRTPAGYKPAGAVSLFCASVGRQFTARCW